MPFGGVLPGDDEPLKGESGLAALLDLREAVFGILGNLLGVQGKLIDSWQGSDPAEVSVRGLGQVRMEEWVQGFVAVGGAVVKGAVLVVQDANEEQSDRPCQQIGGVVRWVPSSGEEDLVGKEAGCASGVRGDDVVEVDGEEGGIEVMGDEVGGALEG